MPMCWKLQLKLSDLHKVCEFMSPWKPSRWAKCFKMMAVRTEPRRKTHRPRSQAQLAWDGFWLPAYRLMASGKSLSLSESQFSHLLNRNNEPPLQVVVRTR